MSKTMLGAENRPTTTAQCPPSPAPNISSSSSLFKDISNFKTPLTKQIPSFTSSRTFQSSISTPKHFTASKKTPSNSLSTTKNKRRPSMSATARRLRKFEIEQSQSSRKQHIKKEKSIRSLACSLTAWLNFLFENPSSCGCDEINNKELGSNQGGGGGEAPRKRERERSGVMRGSSGGWRFPKRMREEEVVVKEGEVSRSRKYEKLRNSMKEVCSLEDLEERMRGYLSLESIQEVFHVMSLVAKNIDEGRLKMKAHCPIVTDVGMREKAVKVLMCYNPVWLQIGLYIIFGGESLLPNDDSSGEQDIAFLKMVIEKQLFSHADLAKTYAYNKLVDGLYRPGYFETLGNVILKRFLLLALVLDRGKSQSSLPIKYGIDGLDGGSPLLFDVKSNIKSSRQMINDFLSSDVMHGEGNLLAHLVIVGFKVSFQQTPLIEYDFRITDLFRDIQDGVRLCRAIQLLKHDSSILAKLVLPADTHKKKISNCSTALEYLKQTGVPVHDDDGMIIGGEDVASGDKELIISLLWNMFIHLQLPLLITKTVLSQEISSICKVHNEFLEFDSSTHLEMLLNWIKALCKNYDMEMGNLASLVDGKAMWCLLDFYFRKQLHCHCSLKEPNNASKESIVSRQEATDAVHNFVLSQKLTTLLGNFPEVLQICDILENNGACNDKSVIILLVFLSSQLLVKKSKDQLNFHKLLGCHCQNPERKRWSISSADSTKDGELSAEDAAKKFKAVQSWWQEMAKLNSICVSNSTTVSTRSSPLEYSSEIRKVNAAIVIQSHFRQVAERKKYLKLKQAVACLQLYVHAWLIAKQTMKCSKISPTVVQEKCERVDGLAGKITLLLDRHAFVNQKSAATLIQKAARKWMSESPQKRGLLGTNWTCNDILGSGIQRIRHTGNEAINCMVKGEDNLRIEAVGKTQLARKQFLVCEYRQKQHAAATIIQNHFRAWLQQERFMRLKDAALQFQSIVRCLKTVKYLQKQHVAATIVQSHFRSWLLQKRFKRLKDATLKIQSTVRCLKSVKYRQKQHAAATIIQSYFRAWLPQKRFMKLKGAALQIQSIVRCLKAVKCLNEYGTAIRSATIIQSHARSWMVRKGACHLRRSIVVMQSHCRCWLAKKNFLRHKKAALRIQRTFRTFMCSRAFHSSRQAATEIQRFVRGRISQTTLLGASPLCTTSSRHSTQILGNSSCSTELNILLNATLKLQRWWKKVLAFKLREKAAVVIQSHIRGCTCRQRATAVRRQAVIIQAHWRGYLARKCAKAQLGDLRVRIQKSAATVEDRMRIMNRLVAALKELKSMKIVSGILHNCATLDLATMHSQKCCERLVHEGAIEILLYQIGAVTRSIPDQQVLMHCLSTFRNLARYANLADALIDHKGLAETILREMLRNKEEGYFIASELLKKLCTRPGGAKTIRRLSFMMKRLHMLVEDLTRKVNHEKRNNRCVPGRDTTEQRLKEAIELLNLISNS